MEPILCADGCGFYGTVENRNLCSKCYKDFLKREIIIPSLKSIAKVDQPDQNDGAVSEVTAQVGGSATAKNRCKSCNKKVGLTGFHCRCGNLFCRRHRLPELHACNVDYKTVPGRNDHELAEVIKVDKLMWRA